MRRTILKSKWTCIYILVQEADLFCLFLDKTGSRETVDSVTSKWIRVSK